MDKENILKELNKAFGNYKFYPADHHYELNGKKVGTSVTRFIEEYANEFDAERIASITAKKENKTVAQVLEEWEYKNKLACTKGSTCHEYAQSLWSGEHWDCDNFDYSPEYENAVFKIKALANNFYNDFNSKWEHLADEYVIGSEEYDIASAVDHLFIDKATGELILADYKTNTYITGYNKNAYEKAMKPPLQHLNDDKMTHYNLQLSIYKYIIEKYTNLKISYMCIVYISEINKQYEIITTKYLKDEVENILEWRKWE